MSRRGISAGNTAGCSASLVFAMCHTVLVYSRHSSTVSLLASRCSGVTVSVKALAPGGVAGVAEAQDSGSMKIISKPIPQSPAAVRQLFVEAKRKARESDAFTLQNALAAVDELQALLDGVHDVLAVDDFARWHDRYELLSQKVTQASEIALRPEPDELPKGDDATDPEEEDLPEIDEELALAGLTIEAVRAELPDGMVLPDPVLAEAVTALRSGKHLLLGGPPGRVRARWQKHSPVQ